MSEQRPACHKDLRAGLWQVQRGRSSGPSAAVVIIGGAYSRGGSLMFDIGPRDFIPLLGAETQSARSMGERASMNSIGLRILLVVAAAAPGDVVPAQAENYFCQQQFALCTSAPCIPEPGNPKVAICTCDVEDGPNLATVPCDTVKPSTDANGVRSVYS